MADRSVSVRLSAQIGEYQAAMARAKASTKDLASTISTSTKKNEEEFKKLGTAAGIGALGLAVGLGKVVSVSAQFEKQMSGVQAVSNASAAEMEKLSDAALKAGASTELAGVSASDAARAEAELVKAGISVNEVLGGALMGSLALASAGQLDFGKSAEIAAQAMNIFNLNGGDVGRVADVLAAAANKSASDVAGLGDALRQGGLVAAQTGLSLEETVGALAAFSDQALVGSDAGTSLKTMLQRLTPQSAEARDKMAELGFSAYDAQGQFIGLEGLADELQTSFQGLDAESRNAALGVVFGSDAIRGANVLMSEGAAGIAEYVTAVDDQGAAARMAALQVDNLAGDVEALGGALESAFIENGAYANGILRDTVQVLTDVVTGFSGLPDGVGQAGVAIAGVGTAGLGVVGAAGMMIPKVREVKDALEKMGAAGGIASAALGPMAAIGLGLAGALALLSKDAGAAARGASELVDAFDADLDTSSVESLRTNMAESRAELDRLREAWDEAGGGYSGFVGTLDRMGQKVRETINPWDENTVADIQAGSKAQVERLEELARLSVNLEGNMAELRNGLGLTEEEVVKLAEAAGVDLTASFSEVVPALESAWAEMQTGSAATMDVEGAIDTLGTTVADATEKADAFDEALDGLFGMFFSVEEASDSLTDQIIDLRDSFAAGTDGVAGNTATLDANTAAGLENREVVRSLIGGVYDLIAAEQRQGATSDELQATLNAQKERLREVFAQLGFNKEETETYIGALDAIPIEVGTQVTVTGAEYAKGLIEGIAGAMARLQSSGIDVAVNAVGAMGVRPFAEGGMLPGDARIQGPGTLVQWAEPETGGEAFIPMAPGKRSRSAAILAQVADEFGYGLVPMATGGVINVNFGSSLAGAGKALANVGVTPKGSSTGLDPEFLRRFRAYSAEVGPLSIISGFRSYAQQAALYAKYLNGTGNLAAPPGRSKHERGLAIDHGPRSTPSMRSVARKYRLHYPVAGEPWHVEPFAHGGIRGKRVGVRSFAAGGILDGAVNDVRFQGGLMGAGIRGATAAGYKGDDIAQVAAAWTDLAQAVGEATANMLLAEGLLASEFVDAAGLIEQRSEETKRALEEQAQAAQQAYEQQVEINNNAFEMGRISLQDHLGNLDRRIARETAYTSEWMALVRQREQVVREDYERRVEINNNLFELGRVSTADHLANLDRRMAREVQYTDEWMALYQQREQVLEDMARREEERAERVARTRAEFRDRVETRQDNMFELGLVDTGVYLKRLEQRLAGEERYSDEWMSIYQQRQQVLDGVARQEEERRREAEEAHQRELDRQREQQEALQRRVDQLAGWADVTQRVEVGWGNSAQALTSNIAQQVEMFTDWAEQLDAVKAMGVSDTVIDMLGLDEGPQALGQLKSLTGATREQLAALNDIAGVRQSQFTSRAIVEGNVQAVPQVTMNFQAKVEIAGKDISDLVTVTLRDMGTVAAIGGRR